MFDFGDSFAPRRIRCCCHRRKILGPLHLTLFPAEPDETRTIPCLNMHQKLPDAVNIIQWLRRCSPRVDILDQFHHRRSMPGAPVKCPPKLVFYTHCLCCPSSPHDFQEWFPPATIAIPAASAAS